MEAIETCGSRALASHESPFVSFTHEKVLKFIMLTPTRFIGPIPAGWLKSNRHAWYKRQLRLDNYSSRAATFHAGTDTSSQRRLTGLEGGPSTSARHGSTFPQPDDIANEGTYDIESDGGSNVEASPVNPILRSTEANADNREGRDLATNSNGAPSAISLEQVPPTHHGRPRTKSSGKSQGDSFATAKETPDSPGDTKPNTAALPSREISQSKF
jgi:hypothetical protein